MGELWERLVEVLGEPVEAFRGLRERPLVLWGFVVAALSTLAMNLLTINVDPEGMLGFELAAPQAGSGAAQVAASVISDLVVFVLQAVFIHYVARIAGGKGSFRQLVSCLGFSKLPGVLQAPVFLIARLFDVVTLAAVGFLVIVVWTVVLSVLAVREAHRFSTARSVGVILAGAIIAAVAYVALGTVAGLVAAPTGTLG